MAYTLHRQDIVWDAMSPSDVIIADLQKGRYSTLSGIGAEFLWNHLIGQNASSDEIIQICRSQFNDFNDQDAEKVQEIITCLLQEGILAPGSRTEPESSVVNPEKPFDSFQIRLSQYDDMQTLLLLDPIDNAVDDE